MGAGEWAEFHGSDLDQKVRELDVVHRRVEAAIVGATEHADRTAHYQTDGHRAVSSWLMATTNCSRSEATARRRSANLVRELATVSSEFMAGRVGIAQVRELARLAANPRVGDQLACSEQVLLDAARSLEFADFRTVTGRWESLADADGSHREHDLIHEFRNARCNFDGAEFRFETSHGVIQGTSMQAVFEAFCQAEFDRDWAWARDTYCDEANASLLPRTAGQRRGDAFVAMILAAAEAGTGNGDSIDTTVNLVSDLDQFEQHTVAEIKGDDTEIEVDPSTVTDRRCETTDGNPSSTGHSGMQSKPSTRCAAGSAATCEHRSATSTTSNPDPGAGQPTQPTAPSCATNTTSSNTPPATPPNAVPTARSPSPAQTAHSCNHPTPPEISTVRRGTVAECRTLNSTGSWSPTGGRSHVG
jgi:hypothetical protein